MKTIIKILTFISTLHSLLPFLKPKDRSLKTLLWIPKLMAGTFSPIHAIICGLGALAGLVRRDWKLASVGLIGAGLAAKYIEDIPESEVQFERAFGIDWEQKIPTWLEPLMLPVRFSLPAQTVGEVQFQQDIVLGQKPKNRNDLLADLWLPNPEATRSGLGLIYMHGSGWRVGDKDLGTRPFFKRLASQGHIVLDVAYSLWPEADLPTMVMELNQAISWMKVNAPKFEINPEKIVLMGGSAGAHLALLAAYAPAESAFQLPENLGDTTVSAVIAYYPPVDLLALQKPFEEYAKQSTPQFLEKAADGMIQVLFQLNNDFMTVDGNKMSHHNMIAEMLGGGSDKIPETYRLLSPITHVDSNCPPTLLLQGTDDLFGLAPGVRELQDKLKKAGVPVVWIEFPHTEHAFDLAFPQFSPAAQAATYDVERFLAMVI
jgi:acetyl esterase/lipase